MTKDYLDNNQRLEERVTPPHTQSRKDPSEMESLLDNQGRSTGHTDVSWAACFPAAPPLFSPSLFCPDSLSCSSSFNRSIAA
jgi:hypothetical protein